LSNCSTFEVINKSGLKNLSFLVPSSFLEQHKISEIFETIDNAIEKTNRIIEKYIHIKHGLMEDLLTGKVRVNHLIKERENINQKVGT